jgi:hypothetical protein
MAKNSTVVANALLAFQVGKTPGWGPPTGLFIQWDTTAFTMPGGTGGVAVTTAQVAGIARLAIAPSVWGAPASGQITTTSQIAGLLCTGGSGATVVAASLWDAATGGQIVEGIPIASFLYNVNVQPLINPGQLSLSIT